MNTHDCDADATNSFSENTEKKFLHVGFCEHVECSLLEYIMNEKKIPKNSHGKENLTFYRIKRLRKQIAAYLNVLVSKDFLQKTKYFHY